MTVPPSNDDRNDAAAINCPACGQAATRTGRRRYCSDACRQKAWRRRTHNGEPPPPPLPPHRSRKTTTIYQCTECDTRYLGHQWCPDCNRPCQRLGPGGHCPCGELLTINELLEGL